MDLKLCLKKLFCLTVVNILFVNKNLFSQNISIHADSVQILLCKKWQWSYGISDGQKEFPSVDDPQTNFEFYTNKTFLITSDDDPSVRQKGTWNYIPEKKLIQLIINGRKDLAIVSIKEDEFIAVFADIKGHYPKQTKIIFTLKTD